MGASPGFTAFLTTSWAVIFVGNLLLALLLPGLLAREFLKRYAKRDILEAAKVGYSIAGQRRGGRVVVLQGRVSLPASPASMPGGSSLDGDQGFLIMSTSLQSYHSRRATAFYRRREHLRQILAVDFRISDSSGDSILVCGRRAADRGKLAAFVQHGTVVPLASSKRIIGFLDTSWLEQEQQFLETHPNLQPSDLVISRGGADSERDGSAKRIPASRGRRGDDPQQQRVVYGSGGAGAGAAVLACERGGVLPLLGLLSRVFPNLGVGATGLRQSRAVLTVRRREMAWCCVVLEPLRSPVNVGEFFLCWGFFPLYFPT
ncbi:unnamed protein product [Closterium sp. Naga37s-1]|nr:unnamed protein product [Closterium sp. Naga37s-1]